MSTFITVNWYDIQVECELEIEPADTSVGLMTEGYSLVSAQLPGGADLVDLLHEKALDELLSDAIREHKDMAESRKVDRQIEAQERRLEAAEGWS
jgi:hypothetical protein